MTRKAAKADLEVQTDTKSDGGIDGALTKMLGRKNVFNRFHFPSFEGICIHAEGCLLDANNVLSDITGYSPDELKSMNVINLIAPEYRSIVRSQVKEGFEKPYEVLALRKDGSTFPMEVQGKNVAFEGKTIRITSFRDITERKRAEELYRILTDKMQAGVYIVQDGKIRFVNSMVEAYAGYRRSEVIGQNGMVMVHPRDRKKVREHAGKMLRGEVTSPYEYRIITKDGRIRRMMGVVSPIYYEGRPAILGNSMDVTELREAREKLEEIEALESSILETIPHAVIGLENRRIIFANNAAQQVFGWKPEELIGKNSRILYGSDSEYEQTGKALYDQRRKRKICIDEMHCQCRDGREILCSFTASKLGTNTRSRKAVAVYEDITERRQAERALVRERDFAESLIETAQAVVLVLDTQGLIVRYNPYTEELVGYALEEMRGKDWLKNFIPREEWSATIKSFGDALRDKQAKQVNTIIARNGSKRLVSWSNKTLRDSNGDLVGLLLIGQDVTETKEAEQKLSENYEKLRYLSSELTRTEERERQQLATELHDRIGQTMAVAKMKLEALQKDAASTEYSESLEEIVHILDQLISDTRSLTFDLSPPVLYILGLEAALEWLTEQHQEKYGLEIVFNKKGTSKEILTKDRAFVLFRCVQELLVNITKHANATHVLVWMKKNGKSVEVGVEDDGAGFDVRKIKTPADWTKGFGLFSIKERLSYLGGQFNIESSPGNGTRARMIMYSRPGRREYKEKVR
ncbi:MAG: PAS domain S-box protein [Syntrophales bacterium]|jgi:PAS domain S-box-containing protein|nr:PAS domain S-box protein [Syntrophales bacterium]MDY0045078.1 PAS domain S-box protein [Syntrophales bacterium]